MRMIKISESKIDKLSEYVEESLRTMGKMMQCVESLSEGGYGEKDDDDWDDDDDEMSERYGNRYGERRGVRGTGRYSRYR